MLKFYSFDLASRFVNDCKLPIAIISDENNFEYELNLYNKNYHTLDMWNLLVEGIEKYFNSDPNKWLNRYYEIRENIIQHILSTKEYAEFNSTSDFSKWKSINIPKCTNSKSAYNLANCEPGKNQFISIDMKKANFQALHYAGVIKEDTYEDFIRQFCVNDFEFDYVSKSKYMRVVWAGQTNPSRQITLEKYILLELYNSIVKKVYDSEVICFNSDEIVLRADSNDTNNEKFNRLVQEINENAKTNVRVELFSLGAYNLYSKRIDGSEHKISEFYEVSKNGTIEYKSIPLPYHKIIHKLLNNEQIMKRDRIITYDKRCDALLLNDFYLKKI